MRVDAERQGLPPENGSGCILSWPDEEDSRGRRDTHMSGSDALDARDGLDVPRWVCVNLQRRRR